MEKVRRNVIAKNALPNAISKQQDIQNNTMLIFKPKSTVSSPFENKVPDEGFVFPYIKKQQNPPEVQARNVDELSKLTGLRPKFINTLIDMEGFELQAYKDQKGIKTIGIGHNIEADSSYKLGDNITREQAYNLLKRDLIKAESQLKSLIGKKKLTQGEKEALVDVTFNVGPEKLKGTKLINYVNKGEMDKAVKELNFMCVGKNANTHLSIRRMLNIKDFSEGKTSEASFGASLSALSNITQKMLRDFKVRIKKTKTKNKKIKLKTSMKNFTVKSSKIITDFKATRNNAKGKNNKK